MQRESKRIVLLIICNLAWVLLVLTFAEFGQEFLWNRMTPGMTFWSGTYLGQLAMLANIAALPGSLSRTTVAALSLLIGVLAATCWIYMYVAFWYCGAVFYFAWPQFAPLTVLGLVVPLGFLWVAHLPTSREAMTGPVGRRASFAGGTRVSLRQLVLAITLLAVIMALMRGLSQWIPLRTTPYNSYETFVGAVGWHLADVCAATWCLVPLSLTVFRAAATPLSRLIIVGLVNLGFVLSSPLIWMASFRGVHGFWAGGVEVFAIPLLFGFIVAIVPNLIYWRRLAGNKTTHVG